MPINSAAVSRSDPPRLAYLVSEYPAVSHTFILREVRQLRELGFDIEVASINDPAHAVANMTPDEHEESERTYYVKRHGWRGALAAHFVALRQPRTWWRGFVYALRLGGADLSKLAYGLFYFTEALMLARWMQAHGLTHLHVHFATAAANVGLLLKHTLPVGLSLTVHGPDEFYDARNEWLPQKLMAADFVVCISRFARSQVMKLTPASHWHKYEVCPLGVDPERYQPMAKTEVGAAFTLLCVGRLAPAKGQRILLEAAHRLAERGRDFRLVLVGNGPDAVDLQAAANTLGLHDKVIFTGALNQAAVLQWYARADAFVLPSFAEGVPVVLMEAMACGIPCITTRITGIPELIEAGRDGLLVTPSDIDALAEQIASLMDDPNLRARLAVAGRAQVVAHYNLQRNVERLAACFRRHLNVSTGVST